GPDLSVWKMAGVDFVPMIWGFATCCLGQASGLPSSSSALLGFNEPNFPNQRLGTLQAAEHWKDVEQLAADYGISTIVSPSMNYHWSMDPIDWLQQFFAHCEGCKVDAIGIHVFTCYAAGLKYHLDRYRIFGKPMWITEIACSDPASPERLSAEGQMAYMREAIPLLEADEDVAKYAWFSYFKDEWAHPIVPSLNGDAGLVHPNGTLTPLGNLYNSFAAGSNLTEINITEPEQLANWRMRWMMMGV
ncbi:Alkali-sensitive linkage protein 1, partial [Durusdinium trenchii]